MTKKKKISNTMRYKRGGAQGEGEKEEENQKRKENHKQETIC